MDRKGLVESKGNSSSNRVVMEGNKMKQWVEQKRRPYRDYRSRSWKWNDVWVAVDDGKKQTPKITMTMVALEYGIDVSTLSRRYSKWIEGGRGGYR